MKRVLLAVFLIGIFVAAVLLLMNLKKPRSETSSTQIRSSIEVLILPSGDPNAPNNSCTYVVDGSKLKWMEFTKLIEDVVTNARVDQFTITRTKKRWCNVPVTLRLSSQSAVKHIQFAVAVCMTNKLWDISIADLNRPADISSVALDPELLDSTTYRSNVDQKKITIFCNTDNEGEFWQLHAEVYGTQKGNWSEKIRTSDILADNVSNMIIAPPHCETLKGYVDSLPEVSFGTYLTAVKSLISLGVFSVMLSSPRIALKDWPQPFPNSKLNQ